MSPRKSAGFLPECLGHVALPRPPHSHTVTASSCSAHSLTCIPPVGYARIYRDLTAWRRVRDDCRPQGPRVARHCADSVHRRGPPQRRVRPRRARVTHVRCRCRSSRACCRRKSRAEMERNKLVRAKIFVFAADQAVENPSPLPDCQPSTSARCRSSSAVLRSTQARCLSKPFAPWWVVRGAKMNDDAGRAIAEGFFRPIVAPGCWIAPAPPPPSFPSLSYLRVTSVRNMMSSEPA